MNRLFRIPLSRYVALSAAIDCDDILNNINEADDDDDGDEDPSRSEFIQRVRQRQKRFLKRKQALQNVTSIIEQTLETCKIPGLVTAVSINGAIVYKQAFGYQDLENKVKCTVNMKTNIGELSQGFLTYFVAILVGHGRLCPDNFDVMEWHSRVFPVPAILETSSLLKKAPPITDCDESEEPECETPIRDILKRDDPTVNRELTQERLSYSFYNLLTHTSGLRDYETGDIIDHQSPYGSLERSIKLFRNDALLFLPGSKFNKTSLGCQVIGSMIEEAAEVDYKEFVKTELVKMGLMDTHLTYSKDLHLNIARPHRSGFWAKRPPWIDYSWREASQGILSTVEDLIKFSHIMFMGGALNVGSERKKLFIRESFRFTSYGERKVTDNSYGFLWHLGQHKLRNKLGEEKVAFDFSLQSMKKNQNSGILLMRWKADESDDKPYIRVLKERWGRRKPFQKLLRERGTLLSIVILTSVEDYDCTALANDLAEAVYRGFQT